LQPSSDAWIPLSVSCGGPWALRRC
jgi:hypothetical protein